MMNNRRHPYRGKRWRALRTLGITLAVVLTMQAPPAQAQDAADARPALRSLSNAFTHVAQKAMPAVVFIQVEKRVGSGQHAVQLSQPI